jgi:hypothetical protein
MYAALGEEEDRDSRATHPKLRHIVVIGSNFMMSFMMSGLV